MQQSYLYDKEVTCLYCEDKFTTKKIKHSKLILKKKDSDFCTHYEGEVHPFYYEVWVCPHCGFAYLESFSELTGEQKERINKEYLSKVQRVKLCEERSIDEAILSFKLALLCASILRESTSTLASILMKLAWLYRFKEEKQEERKYLQKALECYLHIFEKEDLRQVSLGKHKIIYLIGEINGRLENYIETKKWFSLLFSERNIEPALIKIAREQWSEYKVLLSS